MNMISVGQYSCVDTLRQPHSRFCRRVPVHEGIVIVFPLFRSHCLAVVQMFGLSRRFLCTGTRGQNPILPSQLSL